MADHTGLSTASPITSNVPPSLRLPAELLRIIFLYFATGEGDYAHRTSPPSKSLSHVCRQWRNVALACQELWSAYLPRQSPQWTTACLARASSVPLDVVLSIDDYETGISSTPAEGECHGTAMAVVSQWPRVKTLHVKFHCQIGAGSLNVLAEESQVVLDNLLSALSRPNHNLEELSLTLKTQYTLNRWVLVDLPSGFGFSGQRFHELYHIELGYCTLPSSPNAAQIFPAQLRNLKLHNTQAWVDVDSMVQCLRATPMLQHLCCQFDEHPPSLESIRPSRHYQPRCISLPHLDELSLHGFWIQSITIFNYIAAPSWCHIRIGRCLRDDVDYLPEEIVLEHVALGCETFKQHFALAISQGLSYDFVHPTYRDITAVLPSEPIEDSEDEDAVLQYNLFLSFPDTGNELIERAAYDMLLFLPIFAKTRHLLLDIDLWEYYPGWYEQYTTVGTVASFDSDRCLDAFISALRWRGETLFPMLSHIVLADNEIRDLTQLLELVEALRNAHAATDRFELLTLEGSDSEGDGWFTEEVMDEVREQLGSDRVEWLPYDKRDTGLEARTRFSSAHRLKEHMQYARVVAF